MKCNRLGCLNKSVYRGRCEKHSTEERPTYTRDVKEYHKLYSTAGWKALRLSILQQEPLCRVCNEYNYIKAAVDVDHIIDHRGDTKLFYDRNNLQPLCKSCHTRKTHSHTLRGQG